MDRHFTASAIIISNGKVLLIWHKKSNQWLYPGGHVEPNESPDEAVIREVKEETGLDCQIMSDAVYHYQANDVFSLPHPIAILDEVIDSETQHRHIDYVYQCVVNSDNVQLNQIEAAHYTWFFKNQLPDLSLPPDLLDLLMNHPHIKWDL